MKCELLKVQTEDQIRLDGGLFRADEVSSTNSVSGNELSRSDFRGDDSKGDDLSRQTRSPVDLVIFIPGVGSNFYQTGILGKWIPIFNQAGISLLSINTRGHDFLFRNGQRWLGAAVERVDECRLDIAAWVNRAVRDGFQRIVLVGHSLGAVKTIYSQAVDPLLEVKGLVALSPSCLSASRFAASSAGSRYQNCLNQAKMEIESGNGSQPLEVDFPFRLMMSPDTFLDKYGDQEKYNVLRLLPRVGKPTLVTFGEKEVRSSNPAFEDLDHQLRPMMNEGGNAATKRFDMEVLPESDHYYSGMQRELARRVLEWLNKQ